MFNRNSKTSSALDPASFSWRRSLSAVSILGATVFLLWLRYQLLLNFIPWDQSPKENPNEKWPEIQRTPDKAIQQRIASNYCQIKDCNSIECSSISKNLDPGTIASDFIETKFKIDCENAETVKLSFSDCKFPENKLRRNWLTTNMPIDELAFKNCVLDEIEDDIFIDFIYENTKKIILVGNQLRSLRRRMFRHLKTLNELAIQNNIVKLAEFNLLADVADSLSILELSGVINDRETLRNITGGSVSLSSLQILSISENSIPTIDGELFAGVPSVQSLYLDNCKIGNVGRDTLKPIASSIIQLHLNYNNIITLPEGLFDPIIHSKFPFHLMAQNNPWHCDCNLKWIQNFVGTSSSIVIGPPSCKTPEKNAGQSFIAANFCSESNTSAVTSITNTVKSTEHDQSPTTTQAIEIIKERINVTCNFVTSFLQDRTGSRKLMSSDFLQIQSQLPRFNVSEDLDQGILINLPDLDEGVTLLWFNNEDIDGSIGCARNVKHSYLLQSIDPQTSYTICLLDDNANLASPLNCLALTTSPAYQYRTWLRNGDQKLVLGILVFLLLLVFFVGAVVAFLMIRRHPSLLRGSKRVMLVKRRNVEAIVLPKGVDIEEKTPGTRNVTPLDRKFQEDGYITPLPPDPIPLPRRPRMSRISIQSDGHSYALPIEPTDTQMEFWQLTRLNSELETQKSEAPPLPPHRMNAVPSLSLAVDSNEECAGYCLAAV